MEALKETVGDLPYSQVQEFLLEIQAHIQEGLPPAADEPCTREFLQRLGMPQEVAQEFREKMGAPQSTPPTPKKMNDRAITTLILGIFAILLPPFGFFLGLESIYYGATSLKELERTGERGRPLSFVGICLGLFSVLLYGAVILGIVFFRYH